MTMTLTLSRIGCLAAALLMLGACATEPPRYEALERARGNVAAAAADTNVRRVARTELEDAQDAFANADRSARRGLSTQGVDHWT